MAKHGTWTVIFEDKMIIKKTGEYNHVNGVGHEIDDDAFWGQSKFNNLHAIQYTNDGIDNDQVEYADGSPNGVYDEAVLGNFNEFITRYDTAHLAHLQVQWDLDTITIPDENGDVVQPDGSLHRNETEEEKIARLGARPTSYTSL